VVCWGSVLATTQPFECCQQEGKGWCRIPAVLIPKTSSVTEYDRVQRRSSALLSPLVTFCFLGTVVPFQHNGSCDYDCFPHQNRNNQRIAIRDLLIWQKSPDLRLDSGSSWLDGVNGILMQQEPNSPKQDYWNRRAIASLANTLFTSWSQFQHLYCLLCCCFSSRNARMKHCCYTNTCLNSYHYYQLWEGDEWCKEATSGAYLLCNLSPQVNQVMSKPDK
jgi:hypothetical protein